MMMTIWVLLAMAAVMVGSAAAGAPPGRPRLGWRKWFLLFLSSAFLGCCFEVGFVWLSTGLLMSRSSLLYGPFSVVWGLGAVLMTLVLSPLRRYGPWAVFAGGAVLGGGVEYLSSLVLERTFHRLFWDYTALPFDLAGRTNLLFAVFWGGAGLVWVYWLTPRLLRLLDRLPSRGRTGRRHSAGGAVRSGCPPLRRRLSADGGAGTWPSPQQQPGGGPGPLVRRPRHAVPLSEHDPAAHPAPFAYGSCPFTPQKRGRHRPGGRRWPRAPHG